jgi:hypothetical protein
MKPNLFRSINDALAEKFPLLPRIRRSFYGLLMFCCVFLAIGISPESITIPVKPLEGGRYYNQPITIYQSSHVGLGGQFTITNPGFVDSLMLPNLTTDLDMITLIFLAIASIIIIIMVPKLHQQNLFRKDISNYIRLLGYLIIVHGVLSIYRGGYYVPLRIEALTNKEFTAQHHSFPLLFYAELYFALIVIALAGFYERGLKLQEEQDLTV